jgi:hypothetical protein
MGTLAALVAEFLELDVAHVAKLQARVVGSVVRHLDTEVLFHPSTSKTQEPIPEVSIDRRLKGAEDRQRPLGPVVAYRIDAALRHRVVVRFDAAVPRRRRGISGQ